MKIEDNHYTYRIETKDSNGGSLDFIDIDTVEPLRCAYDVQDELNLETNEHIKRVEEIILDANSTEFWYVDETRTSDTHLVCYFEEVELMASKNHPMVDTNRSIFEYGKINSNEHQNTNFICTHVMDNGVSRIYMSIDKETFGFSTFNNETIKHFISNNPVTVWYALRYEVVIPRSMSKGHLLTLGGQTDITLTTTSELAKLPIMKFNIGDTQYTLDNNPIHINNTQEGIQIRNIVLEGNTPINYARGNGVNTTEATSDTRYDFEPFYDGQTTIPNTVEGGYVSAKLYGDTMVNIAKPYGESPLLTATNESVLCDDLLGTNEEGIVLAGGEITEGRIYGDSLVNKWIKGKYSITPSTKFAECEGFKPNTLYTIRLYDVVSVTETAVYDGTETTALRDYSRDKIYTFTTISDKIKLYSRNSEVYQSVNVLILEGDWTETINTIEHFEGIGSVTNPCTIFLNNNFTDKNLFNKDTATVGYTLNTSTGEPNVVNDSYSTSDFIFVAKGHNYMVVNDNCSEMCFYDLNKNFISSISRSFTPTQNGYIRFVYGNGSINIVMFGSFSSTNPIYTEYQQLDMQQATFPYTLNKLPNGVADYIDVVNKIHVQRVGKIVLDSTENFGNTHYSTSEGYYTKIMLIDNSVTGKYYTSSSDAPSSVCDKLKTVNYEGFADKLYEFIAIGGSQTTGYNSGMFVRLLASTDSEWQERLSQLTPITVLYELKTPIYTPLTEEEIAQLPLSAYADGSVMLSSDQLMPSFEFRMRASNRYQVDMLETGYYYLNAPVGNVKLGTANVDVQQMPCIVKIDNVGSGDSGYRLGVSSGFCKDVKLTIDGYYLNIYNGELLANSYRATSDYIYIDYYENLCVENLGNRVYFDMVFYDENKTYISFISWDMVKNYGKFKAPQNAKYFRVSIEHKGNKVIRIFSPTTLAKLPSHRIPTSFAQGMRCATDFGYWEGIKVATSKQLYVNETNQLDFAPIELNRIEYNNTIVEDEFDIATGKLTKRVGKYTIDGNSNIWGYAISQTETATHMSFGCSRIPNFKKGGRCVGFLGLKYGAVNSTDSQECWNNLGVSNALYFRFRKDRYSQYGNGADGVKAYFNINPTTIYYELEIPEISYVNLSSNQVKTVANSTIIQSSKYNELYLNPQVKPSHLTYPVPSLVGNRTYTVVHNRKNITGSTKPIELNLGGTVVQLNDASSKTLVKTPSTLAHSNLIFIGGESTVDHIMVLDGDWTNKPIEYFENMKGHDTDAIITIIGDSKIDDVAEQYLW